MKKLFILLFVGLMFVGLGSAINIDQFNDGVINTSLWEIQNGTGDVINESSQYAEINVLGGVGGTRFSNLTTLSSIDIFTAFDTNVTYRVFSISASPGGANYQALELVDALTGANLTLKNWAAVSFSGQEGYFYKDGGNVKYSHNGAAEKSFDISSWGNVRFRVLTRVAPNTGNFNIKMDWINATTGVAGVVSNPLSPLDASGVINSTVFFNASIAPTGATLKNATLFLFNSTGDLINETTNTLSGTTTVITNFTIDALALGTYTWNVQGCTTGDICDLGGSNFSFTKGGNFLSFEDVDPALETLDSRFAVNVSVGSGVSVQTAILSYNGTNYTSTSKTEVSDGEFTIVRSITIPSGIQGFNSEVRNYEWILTLVDEVTGDTFVQTSASQTQTVNELTFALCDASILHSVLNFTMFDELTGELLNATNNATTFQATFNVGASPDSLIKNYSISNISVNTNEFDFCTNQTTNNIYVDMVAFFTAVDYTDKNYNLNGANLSVVENEVSLFLIPDSEAIQFFITVIENLNGVADVTVQVAKFFVGEGLYKTVEIDVTDTNGEFTSYLELDKDYRFTIIQNGEVLGIIDRTSFCQAAPCTMTLNLDSAADNPLSGFQTAFAADVVYNLSFNPVTKIVTFDFVDTTGLATSFRMDIIKSASNQSDIIVSSQRVFTSSGSMTFNATSLEDGNYRVSTYVSRSPDVFIDFITFVLSTIAGALGGSGLIVALLFVLVVVFSVARSPLFLILSIPLALQALQIMGIFVISDGALMALWVIGGMLAFLVGNR